MSNKVNANTIKQIRKLPVFDPNKVSKKKKKK